MPARPRRPSLPSSSLLEAVHNALRVGVHWGTEVARSRKAPAQERHRVCQVYSSALPVAYNKGTPSADWRAFATAVLRATFEATLLAAAVPHRGSPIASRGARLCLLAPGDPDAQGFLGNH